MFKPIEASSSVEIWEPPKPRSRSDKLQEQQLKTSQIKFDSEDKKDKKIYFTGWDGEQVIYDKITGDVIYGDKNFKINQNLGDKTKIRKEITKLYNKK